MNRCVRVFEGVFASVCARVCVSLYGSVKRDNDYGSITFDALVIFV